MPAKPFAKPFLCLAAMLALIACSPPHGGQSSGPPEWFLRKSEAERLDASRAAATQGPSLRFAVATDQPIEVFSGRIADVVERCWVGGEPGWTVERAPASVSMVQTRAARPGAAAGPQTMLSLVTTPGAAVGFDLTATGPLARPPYRPRILSAIERAKATGPVRCGELSPAG